MVKENNSLAIFYIIAGMTVFSVQDTIVRILASEVSILQIMFLRSVVGLSVLFLYLKVRKIPIIFSSQYPVLTIIRAILFMFAFLFYYIGLAYLPYAVTTALFFTTPFFITILSKVFLKENIGIIRLLTIIFGFIGVVIIANPTFDSFNIFMIFPILCAFGYSASMIIIKMTSEKDSVYSQTFHVYLSTLLFAPLVTYIGSTFDSSIGDNQVLNFVFRSWELNLHTQYFLIFVVGICVVAGFLLIFNAYRVGKPFVIAPFEYTILLWSIFYGWLIWDESVTVRSWVGMAMIVAAGIYLFYRERVNEQEITVDQPLR
jgi:drug/metabolite transporter (DMT)-like permease